MEELNKINFETVTWKNKTRYRCKICGKRYKNNGVWLEGHAASHKDKGGDIFMAKESDKFHNSLKEEEFNKIKELLATGMKLHKTAAKVDRSYNIVRGVNESKDFKNYRIYQSTPRENRDNFRKNKGIPLSQEEFDQIKELIYRGEPRTEIKKILGRGTNTITLVDDVQTLEEYFDISRANTKKYRKNGASVVKPTTQSATLPIRYKRLKEFRERLDEVLIDFILEEIGHNHDELMRDNEQLIAENNRLKQRLDEALTPNFTQGLFTKLSTKEE